MWVSTNINEHLGHSKNDQVKKKDKKTHHESPPHDVGDVKPIPPRSPHLMRRGSSDKNGGTLAQVHGETGPQTVQSMGELSG